MFIQCLYCGKEFEFKGHNKDDCKCPKCGEGTALRALKKPTIGDVFGYGDTEKKEKKTPSTVNGYMYGDDPWFYNED